ncbi:hypothetical protein AQJ64_07215 [Streptomyces griseoruber]|uniref:Uncharacterized protein n=1 Tax=Streptomyces griseoruber TaxID=1943 RepID=A0A101T7E8_9ACTN|nr:hypothetical protein AQJ64_07215 [Streptomyces griseoruber]
MLVGHAACELAGPPFALYRIGHVAIPAAGRAVVGRARRVKPPRAPPQHAASFVTEAGDQGLKPA